MADAPHINDIATAVPRHDVHHAFRAFAAGQIGDPRSRQAFDRLADKSQIDHRQSVLEALPDASGSACGFYRLERFPSTGERMARYEAEAPALAEQACLALGHGDGRAAHHTPHPGQLHRLCRAWVWITG